MSHLRLAMNVRRRSDTAYLNVDAGRWGDVGLRQVGRGWVKTGGESWGEDRWLDVR